MIDIILSIIGLISVPAFFTFQIIRLSMKPKRPKNPDYPENTEKPYVSSFSVADYLKRTEEAYLKILEEQEPFEYELVLWWGLDGLRLNKDGTTEWISRRKKTAPLSGPLPEYIRATPMPAFTPIYPNMCGMYNSNFAPQFNYLDMHNSMQAPQSAMDQFQAAIDAQQVQASQQVQNEYLMQILATCCNAPRERRW